MCSSDLRKSREVWDKAVEKENFRDPAPSWEQMQDLIGVLLLQEMIRRRKRSRERFRVNKPKTIDLAKFFFMLPTLL